MRVPVLIAGAAAAAALLSALPPTVQQHGDFKAGKIRSPFAAKPFAFSGWTPAGGGLLHGIGYTATRANIAVVGHGNQFAALGTGPLDRGPAGGTNGTVSGLTAGDFSALSFQLANEGGRVASAGSDVANQGGQMGAPQMLMASLNNGAIPSNTFTAPATGPAQSTKDSKGFVPQTQDLVTTGTTGNTVTPGTTLSLTNLRNDILRNDMLRNDMGPDNVPTSLAAQAVPEPAMLAVLAVGLVGLGVVRRRMIG